MHVLVIGGVGDIGACTVDAVLEHGHRVRVLDQELSDVVKRRAPKSRIIMRSEAGADVLFAVAASLALWAVLILVLSATVA